MQGGTNSFIYNDFHYFITSNFNYLKITTIEQNEHAVKKATNIIQMTRNRVFICI